MKKTLRLFVGLCMTASVALATGKLSEVAFVVGKQQFKTGDAIVIDQVRASSPKLAAGDAVVVRGHYRLTSASRATIGLFVTHASATTAIDPVSPSQTTNVKGLAGSFELTCKITYAGALHVSFYSASGDEALGGVYLMPR